MIFANQQIDKLEGIKKDVWENIKSKIVDKNISVHDLEGTLLMDMFNTMYYGDFNIDDNDLLEAISPLLELAPEPTHGLYCIDTLEGIQYYSTKNDFLDAYERDWCDYKWNDLSDELLTCWIERLFNRD